ncbi:ABC transporter permease subunit [Streptomyces ipomoeae]|jgi:ABC-type proline/glycine betaine transport system permease subunit|nr:ABC transporter permease subunit [Streptomyces ipomoeae]MDX2693519.1 ABC transporter permease subunit [Streptomyces ipomoeae]MDX2823711.1 ABC transporter permease subunit [Streptomyces ipomoeae]MDX2840485.1 ABC transporter permease subunit [Streptomyces ipomoeae]MDX2876335.1 ABC transporter permease subunit [Streptomyces ipomoeae]TQE17612.1 ABC transporter permease subunit [Streptomyces ipomoeae]
MTVVMEKPEKTETSEPVAPVKGVRKISRSMVVAAILVAWLLLFAVLRGRQTLTLAAADLTDLHHWFNDVNDSIGANRNSNPVFLYFFNEIRLVIDNLVTFIQELISQAPEGRPVPQIGWLGVIGIAGYLSWAAGNWRVALLAVAGFTFLGLQGLWQESMDTLALTLSAVFVALLIGIPLGVMAIVLDRVTTAASAREESARRSDGRFLTWRKPLLGAGAVVTAVLAYMSHTYVWAAEFPGEGGIGRSIASTADTVTTWIQDHLAGLTNGFRDAITNGLLNPFQTLLTDSPWWLVGAVLIGLGVVLGGRRAGLTAAICVGLLVATGVWSDSMTTLASTVFATVLVMLLGVGFGVWMGRSQLVDRVLRPTLDAAQVMPPFVYLVPFLALFGPTRFTAIVAAVVYAAPVAIKIIADGVRGVPQATVEAATSAGCDTRQIITKVQLPMARSALTLATNQGLIYVLSMVVVGGLVGAGALGYDVVAGFSQGQLYGKGLAAGLAIVLLGVMFDRITQAAARRTSA